MDKVLYNHRLILPVSDFFEDMLEDERNIYFNGALCDYAYIMREKNALISVTLNEMDLSQSDVERRISAYHATYSRLAPGFVFGEMKIKSVGATNTAVLSFKSNALERDLYNLVIVSNLSDKELVITFHCDIRDSFFFTPIVAKMLNEMQVKNPS